jgi:hypothetical protein
MAMTGGGPGSFIGAVHRIAAELDGEIRLVRVPSAQLQGTLVLVVAPDRPRPTRYFHA